MLNMPSESSVRSDCEKSFPFKKTDIQNNNTINLYYTYTPIWRNWIFQVGDHKGLYIFCLLTVHLNNHLRRDPVYNIYYSSAANLKYWFVHPSVCKINFYANVPNKKQTIQSNKIQNFKSWRNVFAQNSLPRKNN